MATKGRAEPRVVCCAIPIWRASGKVLIVTSRKRPESWVCECTRPLLAFDPDELMSPTNSASLASSPSRANHAVPKGGWEPTDGVLEAAALREALEEGLILCPSVSHPF